MLCSLFLGNRPEATRYPQTPLDHAQDTILNSTQSQGFLKTLSCRLPGQFRLFWLLFVLYFLEQVAMLRTDVLSTDLFVVGTGHVPTLRASRNSCQLAPLFVRPFLPAIHKDGSQSNVIMLRVWGLSVNARCVGVDVVCSLFKK